MGLWQYKNYITPKFILPKSIRITTGFSMASDKKESKKAKDLPAKKGDVRSKKKEEKPKAEGPIKVEVMKKDTPGIKKKTDLGASADELYATRGKGPVAPLEKKGPPLLCPDCGHELKDGSKKCPNCGLALGDGEEIVCAVCGGLIDPGSEVCPLCGTRLSMATDEAKAHLAVPDANIPIEDISHHHHELRKDKERPEVTVSPEELAPKAIIGKGPKGAKVAPKGKKGKVAPRRAPPRKRGLLESPAVIPIFIVILLVAAVLIVELIPRAQMTVDGKFDDWSPVTMHSDEAQAGMAAGTQIVHYAVKLQGSDVFLYMQSNGDMFPGGNDKPSYAVVFIDTDRNVTTGYNVQSLGAERMLTVKGWDGSVKETKLYSFDPSAGQLDWKGFKETSTFKATASGSELELVKDLTALGLTKDSKPAIRFALLPSSGPIHMSDAPVGLQPGGMAVTQNIRAPTAPVAPGTMGQVFMTMKIDAKGKDDTLQKVTFTRTGQGPLGDVQLVTLWSSDTRIASGKLQDVPGTNLEQITFQPKLLVTTGHPAVLTLKMDLWDKASGGTLGAMILSTANITFAHSPSAIMTVQEGDLTCYINRTPSVPVVDGVFGDWNAVNSDEHLLPGGNPRTDLDLKVLRDIVESSGRIKVELEVTGDILQGSPTPGLSAMNGTCTVGPACPGTGESVAMVLIDIDNKTTTGKNEGIMGADYAVIVHGKYGNIEQASLGIYSYDPGKDSWELVTAQGVSAHNDQHRMEIGLDLTKTAIQPGAHVNYMIELKDALNYGTMSPMIKA